MKWQAGESPLNRSANRLILDDDMVYSDRICGVKVLRKQRCKGKLKQVFFIRCHRISPKWGDLSPTL